jgi:hypothetical protein
MKKLIFCLSLSALLSMQESNGMRLAKSLRSLHLQRMTPCIVRRLYTLTRPPQWPDYTREQADLIASTTLRNNHLEQADAYDTQSLGSKIEKTTATLCPEHHPSKCRTCWLPQKKAFSLVSEELSKKQ